MRKGIFISFLITFIGCTTEPTQVGSVRLHFVIKQGKPSNDSLYPVFPNPFNRVSGDTSLILQFSLRDSGSANLLIQNALGDPVATYSDSLLPPGFYNGPWNPFASDGTPLMNGIYFVTLRQRNYINSRLVNIQENE